MTCAGFVLVFGRNEFKEVSLSWLCFLSEGQRSNGEGRGKQPTSEEFREEFARKPGERSQEGFLNGCCGGISGRAAVSHALHITLDLFKKKKKDNKTKQNPKPKLIIFQQSSQRLQQRARWRR